MSEKQKSVHGAGVTERQEDWTIETVTRDYVANKFQLSRRKTAWLVQSVERIIQAAWNEKLEEEVAEWAPDDFVVQLGMPRLFFPDQISRQGFWYELAAYISDLLSPRDEESEMGYLDRRQEMHDACDEAGIL